MVNEPAEAGLVARGRGHLCGVEECETLGPLSFSLLYGHFPRPKHLASRMTLPTLRREWMNETTDVQPFGPDASDLGSD